MNTLMKNIIPSIAFTALLLFASNQSYADTYTAKSAKHPVALIELYTSQGCSSCPPAEEWLGNLEKKGLKNNQVIPLALHVDYWDYIGWQDQFAQKYFSKRQYQYKKTNHSTSVYTPQIMFNGNDVRDLSLNNSLTELSAKDAVVSFNLAAKKLNDKRINVTIDFDRVDSIAKASNVVVVLAENNLVGDIKSGENVGRKLKHNHVVRIWKNLGKIRSYYDLDFAIKPTWELNNLEVVVIVETADMQTQQALQLRLK